MPGQSWAVCSRSTSDRGTLPSMPRRPDPLKELLDLQERMNRLFDETLSRESTDDMVPFAPSWVPLADVYDTRLAVDEHIEILEILQSGDGPGSEAAMAAHLGGFDDQVRAAVASRLGPPLVS